MNKPSQAALSFLEPRLHQMGHKVHFPRLPRYKIVDNELYVKIHQDYRFRWYDEFVWSEDDDLLLQYVLLEILSQHNIPNTFFVCNLFDHPEILPEHQQVPTLGYVTTARHVDIPIPFTEHWTAAMTPLKPIQSWSERQGKVYFRGALCGWDGPAFDGTGRKPSYMRYELYKSFKDKSWADIYLVNEDDALFRNYKRYLWRLRQPRPIFHLKCLKAYIEQRMIAYDCVDPSKTANNKRNYRRFKYLLAMDGVSFIGRLPELFKWGGLVLKNNSSFLCAATPLLKPWENFVPFQPDGSDFEAVVERLIREDDKAQAIAEQGFLDFQQYMQYNNYLSYIKTVLERISTFYSPGLDGYTHVSKDCLPFLKENYGKFLLLSLPRLLWMRLKMNLNTPTLNHFVSLAKEVGLASKRP